MSNFGKDVFMAYKNMVSVKVCGRTMTLTGNESVEYITRVANYIEEKAAMLRASDNSKNLSATMVSVLTSINIADDYFKAVEEINKLKSQLPVALDAEEGVDKAYITKAAFDELKSLKEENEKLKAQAQQHKKDMETRELDVSDLEKENKLLKEQLEGLESQYSQLKAKAQAIEEDNIKKIAQINHLKSMESRFLEYEKKAAAEKAALENKEIIDEQVNTVSNAQKDVAETQGKEQVQETPKQPFHMNSNAKLKKTRTNNSYYRQI